MRPNDGKSPFYKKMVELTEWGKSFHYGEDLPPPNSNTFESSILKKGNTLERAIKAKEQALKNEEELDTRNQVLYAEYIEKLKQPGGVKSDPRGIVAPTGRIGGFKIGSPGAPGMRVDRNGNLSASNVTAPAPTRKNTLMKVKDALEYSNSQKDLLQNIPAGLKVDPVPDDSYVIQTELADRAYAAMLRMEQKMLEQQHLMQQQALNQPNYPPIIPINPTKDETPDIDSY